MKYHIQYGTDSNFFDSFVIWLHLGFMSDKFGAYC